VRFHVLADSRWQAPTQEGRGLHGGWSWSYRTDVCLDGPTSRVAVSQTAPKENHAAVLTLDEALSTTWRDHLELSGGAWLEPWLRQLWAAHTSSPEDLQDSRRAVLDAFERRHGRPPTTYEWEVA